MDDQKPALPPNLPIDNNSAGSPPSNLKPSSPPQPQPPAGSFPRSSIRTMESDINSVKTGQVSKGTEVKMPVFPGESAKPSLPPVSPSAPVSPSVPSVGVRLGEAEKRNIPLPGQDKIIPPKFEAKVPENKLSIPTPTPTPSQIVPPLPSKPTPVLPVPPKTQPVQGGISVPATSSFGGGKIAIMVVIGILAILGGFLFFGTDSEDVSVTTPTPTTSPTSTLSLDLPSKSTIAAFFEASDSGELTLDQEDQISNFQSKTVNLSSSHSQKNTFVSIKDGATLVNYSFSDFLNRFSINFPVNLVSYVKNDDFGLVLTKQTEFFDQKGKPIASPLPENILTPKISLIVRVTDAAEANLQLALWESTMPGDLNELYNLSLSGQEGSQVFLENTYQGALIRYLNFPYPDKAIDYVIVTAKNGNDYLVIANSRQQMYSIVDKLLGF